MGFFYLILPARKIQTAPSRQILRTKSRNETKKESSMFSYERRFTQMCDLSRSGQAGQARANSSNCDPPSNPRLCLEPAEVHPPLKVTHTNYRRNLSNWLSLFKSHIPTFAYPPGNSVIYISSHMVIEFCQAPLEWQ